MVRIVVQPTSYFLYKVQLLHVSGGLCQNNDLGFLSKS
jgi:hypothetical protein